MDTTLPLIKTHTWQQNFVKVQTKERVVLGYLLALIPPLPPFKLWEVYFLTCKLQWETEADKVAQNHLLCGCCHLCQEFCSLTKDNTLTDSYSIHSTLGQHVPYCPLRPSIENGSTLLQIPESFNPHCFSLTHTTYL